MSAVEAFFDPEFFNRIDETVVMDPFESTTARQVTVREIDLIVERLARESVDLRIDPAVIVYGARGLRRTIRGHLAAPIANCLLPARPTDRHPITLTATLSADTTGAIAVAPM